MLAPEVFTQQYLVHFLMGRNTTVNVAVIGAGAIGLNHIQSFQDHPAARVVALAETSPIRGKEAADRFCIPDLYTDYKDVLARKDVDVVSIALPNFLHAPVGLDALSAGKHLMIDKPMATNAADAARVIALARRKKRHLMIGQNIRFTPEVQTIKQLVTRGKLGDVYHAKARWMRRSGIPKMGTWFTQKALAGGGCTYDIGVHALDMILHLMDDFDAAAVSGQTFTRFGNRGLGEGGWGKSEVDPSKPFDVDDMSNALIKMKSGRTVLLEVTWAAHQPTRDENGGQLFGTEGGATTNPAQFYRSTKTGYVVEQLNTSACLVTPNRMGHFVDVVLGKAEPYVQPAQSLAVQKILDAIYESSATGREVRIR
ncbi:MAG: Gfo/Idh/MocA family oxidoreductase [Opitutaceae bacterium]